MFFILLFRVTSKEVVENPPISYGVPTTNKKTSQYTAKSISELETYLTNSGLYTRDQVSKHTQKMRFSTSSSTLDNSFEMTINPYSTSSRTATKISTITKITKSGSSYKVSLSTAYVSIPVYSKVVTTTSKTFLWWEWDKQTTITWRPLTAKELTNVHAWVDMYMIPLIDSLK
jgi:hypothetical protein